MRATEVAYLEAVKMGMVVPLGGGSMADDFPVLMQWIRSNNFNGFICLEQVYQLLLAGSRTDRGLCRRHLSPK